MYIYNWCTNLLSPTCNPGQPNPCILILNVGLQWLTWSCLRVLALHTCTCTWHYNTVMNIHVCVHINCVLTCLVRQGISIINSWSSVHGWRSIPWYKTRKQYHFYLVHTAGNQVIQDIRVYMYKWITLHVWLPLKDHLAYTQHTTQCIQDTFGG